jgi:hypothetical protein
MDTLLHQLLLLAPTQHAQELKIIQLHKVVPAHLLGTTIHQHVVMAHALGLKILLTIEVALVLLQVFQTAIVEHAQEQKVL